MAGLREQEIDEIRRRADIVDIVGSYIPLKFKGKNYFGVCPFHNDHSPSMSVSKELQIYKCFSCGAGGNVFKFVSDFENISFLEAVKIVADKIGVNVNIGTTTTLGNKTNKKEFEVMSIANNFFQNNINTGLAIEAKKYLRDRDIDDKAINKFQIGLALDDNQLIGLLEKKEYSHELLEGLGLVVNKGDSFYDVFVNRIIFPICNDHGDVIGFTGRLFHDGSPKYLNTKETSIFKKGKTLYNYHLARDSIRLNKKLIIVEGNMDAIRLSINGIENVIALMGTQMTTEQVTLIKKLRVPVILMLDNDDAGFEATYNVGLMLEKEDIKVLVVRLSKEKDPDSYIVANGVEAINENIDKAISLTEFKLEYFKKNKNLADSQNLLSYVKEVLSSLIKTQDPILVEITLKKLSQEYDLSYDLLNNEYQKIILNEKIEESSEIIADAKPIKKIDNPLNLTTKYILYMMMCGEDYINLFKEKIGIFSTKEARDMANEIMYYNEANGGINLADFITYAHISPLKDQLLDIINSIELEEINNDIMEESINIYLNTEIRQKIKELKLELKRELDNNRKMEIAQEIQNLKKEV